MNRARWMLEGNNLNTTEDKSQLRFILVLNNEDIQFGVWHKFHVLFFERQPQGLEAVRASWWWWLWGGDETSTSGIMVNTNTIGPAPQNMVGATTIVKKPTAQIALEQNCDARGRFIRSKETEKSVNAELDPRPAFHRHIFIFLTKCQPSPILLRGQKMCLTRDMCVNCERQIRNHPIEIIWRGLRWIGEVRGLVIIIMTKKKRRVPSAGKWSTWQWVSCHQHHCHHHHDPGGGEGVSP